jgi:hypothetical protein
MFDQYDTSRLERTPSSAGNRKTWTWSGWVKRSDLNVQNFLFSSADSSVRNWFGFFNNELWFDHTNGSYVKSDALYRDVNSWYHIVVAWDTTQSTDTNRIKIYINGEQISLTVNAWPALNQDGEINNNSGLYIGSLNTYAGYYFDGYLAEINFIDGQALTPSDFGKTNIDTNQWVATKYKGSYGTNGFYLNFNDSSSIGNDSSGNSNNFTTQNLVAADIKTDTPTNNFATLNSTTPDLGTNGGAPTYTPAYRNGNLMTTNPPSNSASTIVIPRTGKWYAEFRVTGVSGGPEAGMKNIENLFSPSVTSNFASYRIYAYTPNSAHVAGKDINNVDTALASLTFNGGGPYEWAFAYDADNGVFKYYYNGTLVATESSVDTSYDYVFFIKNTWNTGGGTYYANFGQDSTMHGTITGGSYTDANGYGEFKYQPPADHLALCTANLPDPSIALPKEHFNTVLYSGNSSTQSITGVGFQPDLSWTKVRNAVDSHVVVDVVRGDKALRINSSIAEYTTGVSWQFDSDGFTMTGTTGELNYSSYNYAVWNWKAGGTAVTNNEGTITSTVSANTTAGFSIATYTGTGNADTFGHGLSKAPELMLFKKRASNGSDPARVWAVWDYYLTESGGNKYGLVLNQTNAEFAAYNNTQPTSSLYTLTAGYQEQNFSGDTYVAYFFHSVDGYSKVGFYRGNGTTNGSYVYTGFTPQWVMAKQINSARDWIMYDNKRSEFNVMGNYLHPNLSNAEGSSGSVYVDFLSNGFKWYSGNASTNINTGQYIYLAFAESPFKYSNAR